MTRRGRFIVVAGPDGVGKTSLADAIELRVLSGLRVRRLHHRANFLPRRAPDPRSVLEPHRQEPYPAGLSVLKVVYLYADRLLGWFFWIRPFLARGGWVVMERGWFDAAVDPRRYRLGESAPAVVRRLGSAGRRPDLTLILEAPPAVIEARSRQLPIDELTRQARVWREILPADWPRVTIDASQPREEVLQAAATALAPLLAGVRDEDAPSVRTGVGRPNVPDSVPEPATVPPSGPGRAPVSLRKSVGFISAAVARARWGFADQALSSLTNFAVGLVVARSVSTVDFGAFALAFAVYLAALNGSRAVTSLPLTIRYSGSPEGVWRDATAAAAGMSLLVGAAFGAACLAFALAAGGSVGAVFVVLAPLLPGLLLQDLWRFAFFARGMGLQAFANDGLWALVQLPAYGLMLLSVRGASVGLPLLIWGGSASVAAVIGIAQAGVWPKIRRARWWWRVHRDLAPRYVGEYAASTGGDLIQPYGIGAVAGLVAVGTMRAGELLLGPFNVVFQGAQLVALPEAARTLQASPERLRHACVLITLALAGAAAAWGAFVLLIPGDIGSAILGSNWGPARTVLAPLVIWLVGVGAGAGAVIGMRALAAARRSLRTRIILTTASVSAVIVGAAVGGAVGAAVAVAAATWLGVTMWWWQFSIALREHRSPMASVSATVDHVE